MKYRYVGKSGLRVSLSGLGCNNFGWRIDFEGSRGVVHAALDAGITLFDTADIYGHRGGSEECLGKYSARGARTSCSQPSSAWQWPTTAASRADRAATS